MELLVGKPLRAFIADSAVSMLTRIHWIAATSRAVAAAHARGIIHRDLKPENVFITVDGTAKVLDFGIARIADGATNPATTGVIVGTPAYMAPEQFLGTSVDARADQYALGLVGAELVLGRLLTPLERLSDSEIASLLRPHLEVLGTSTARRVADAFATALARDPTKRHSSVEALMQCLPGHRSSPNEESATSGETMPKSWRARRSRAWSATAALALVFGATVATLSRPHIATTDPPLAPSTDIRPEDVPGARCSLDAQTGVEAGLQLWRDASQPSALARLDGATKADPSCASAHLYFAIIATHIVDAVREHFRTARELRAHLSERERALLDMTEPLIAEHPNFERASTLSTAALAARPSDPDYLALSARYNHRAGNNSRALELVDQLIKLKGPHLATGYLLRGRIRMLANDAKGAHDAFDACLEAAPDSADCLQWSAWLAAETGNCRSTEELARRLVATAPDALDGYSALAWSLYDRTKSPDAAEAVLRQRWTRATELVVAASPSKAAMQFSDGLALATVRGDLEESKNIALRWIDATATARHSRMSAPPVLDYIDVLLELGESRMAGEVATKYASISETWTADELIDPSIELLRRRYLAGAISPSEYVAMRNEWAERNPSLSPSERWTDGTSGLPHFEAIGEPPPQDVTPALFSRAEAYLWHAKTLEQLGRLDEAFVLAARGSSVCVFHSPLSRVTGHLLVGHLAERKGMRTRACDEFLLVARTWAHEPRSRTAREARERIDALQCPHDAPTLHL